MRVLRRGCHRPESADSHHDGTLRDCVRKGSHDEGLRGVRERRGMRLAELESLAETEAAREKALKQIRESTLSLFSRESEFMEHTKLECVSEKEVWERRAEERIGALTSPAVTQRYRKPQKKNGELQALTLNLQAL